MKTRIILLFSLVFLLSFSNIFAIGDENDENENSSALFVRGGFSDITGFAGGEYIYNNLGFSLGWHKYSPSIASETASSVDVGLFWYGAPYYENSWYLAIGYASNNAVQTVNNELESFYPTWSLIGGYHWGGELLDLKLGCGYLTSDPINGIAIDLSIGLKIN